MQRKVVLTGGVMRRVNDNVAEEILGGGRWAAWPASFSLCVGPTGKEGEEASGG